MATKIFSLGFAAEQTLNDFKQKHIADQEIDEFNKSSVWLTRLFRKFFESSPLSTFAVQSAWISDPHVILEL